MMLVSMMHEFMMYVYMMNISMMIGHDACVYDAHICMLHESMILDL